MGIVYAITPELVDHVLRLMCLSILADEFEGLYRVAGKGIRIFGPPMYAPVPFSLDAAVISYESRQKRFETLAGRAGVWFDPTIVKPQDKELCGIWEAAVHRKKHPVFVSVDPVVKVHLNYTPIRWSDIPFDTLIAEFESTVRRVIGIEAAKLISFLYTLSHAVYEILQYPFANFTESGITINWGADTGPDFRANVLSHWIDAGAMGIIRASDDAWCSKLSQAQRSVRQHDPSIVALDKQSLHTILAVLTASKEFRVFEDRPTLFWRLSENTVVLDLLQGELFTRNLLLAIARSGLSSGGGDVSGLWLERQASGYLVRELGLNPQRVLFRRKMRAQTEIDLAFVFRNVLFVIDCKAMSKDIDYYRGVHKKIRNHISTIEKELTKCASRIDLLRAGAAKSIINPDEFRDAYGLVCTANVAYLPLNKRQLWHDKFPLAAPPNELLETIKAIAQEVGQN